MYKPYSVDELLKHDSVKDVSKTVWFAEGKWGYTLSCTRVIPSKRNLEITLEAKDWGYEHDWNAGAAAEGVLREWLYVSTAEYAEPAKADAEQSTS